MHCASVGCSNGAAGSACRPGYARSCPTNRQLELRRRATQRQYNTLLLACTILLAQVTPWRAPNATCAGIGRSVAVHFAREGADVAIFYRDGERHHGHAHAWACPHGSSMVQGRVRTPRRRRCPSWPHVGGRPTWAAAARGACTWWYSAGALDDLRVTGPSWLPAPGCIDAASHGALQCWHRH